ncbi:MAG: AMP-binding protein [Zoogloeaceae bacterium]|jgi:long-subunit acyl-CoA synthetase (AMP-forming)|nr:AMP-binding protein [Zoogloeaceae bacterium]
MALLLEALAAWPDDALLLAGAGQNWRAAEVRAAVAALGARLTGANVVAVLADNGPAWAIADLAALNARCVHLPLPGFFSAGQIEYALEQSGADTVLTDQPERIGELGLGFAVTGQWQNLTWLRRPPGAFVLPPGTAKISFTSGSTGTPKGVCLSADGLYQTAAALVRRLDGLPLPRHLAVLPLSLLLENVAGLYAPLLRRMPVHLPPLARLGWQGMAGFDPAALQAAVSETQPGSLILVPELLKAWSLYLAASQQRPARSLAYVAVGGARIARGTLAQARAEGIPAYQGYGLTECGSVVAVNTPGDDGDDVGRPLDHVAIRIVGGEVLIRAAAFLGYVGGEGQGAGEFASGDLGQLTADGHLHLSGRRRNVLITSFGRNISPEWVEAALLAQPAILQAVVTGDGEAALSAILVPRPGASDSDIEAAVAFANRGLPDYARVGHWQKSQPFSPANGLATGNGRPLREAIAARFPARFPARFATLPEEP